MAKKKENLSLEEMLEQALVKEEDRPYKVPENWVWTRLDYISEIITGGTPAKANPENYGTEFPFIKPADLDQERRVRSSSEYLSKVGKRISRIVPAGSTSICCIGTVGKAGYLEVDATTNQQINTIVPRINNLFTYYYCLSDVFQNKLNALASATTISIVNKSKMSTVEVPLPPLLEQQRIVYLIESLFEKLDRAKELMQNALDSFENRKSAILHKAFTGELTAKWREENGVDFEKDWVKKKFGDVVKFSKDKYDPFMNETEYKYIGLEHIEKNQGIVNNGLSEDVKSLKNKFIEGDILYGKLRPYLNKHDIAPFEGICSTDILVIRCTNEIINKFLNFHLSLPRFIQYCVENSKGINLPRISEKEIANYVLNVPPRHEQQEIVSILDSLLEKEQKAKELCNLIENIDYMKKSILARAFRGELGTNNPEEESALELLKEVLTERNS